MTHVLRIERTLPNQLTLPWVDYSSLSAVNTCPRWGLIHSIHGKHFPTPAATRTMPLEAGSAMHDVFAAVRMFDLITYNKRTLGRSLSDPLYAFGKNLFRSDQYPDRWDMALQILDHEDDMKTTCIRFALHVLETSGFHDDPNDTRRTQTNLETVAISYIDNYPLQRFIPVQMRGSVRYGIEVPFDMCIYLDEVPTCRFVGRIDGLCIDTERSSKPIEVHENKTGSRIDTVWSASFETSHQITGYVAASRVLIPDTGISSAVVWGSQIPVPRTSMYGNGNSRLSVSRGEQAFIDWSAWVSTTLRIIGEYASTPTDAPMYTHSCNRYFRACSLIPLCIEDAAQRRHMFEYEMVEDRWSPLDKQQVHPVESEL